MQWSFFAFVYSYLIENLGLSVLLTDHIFQYYLKLKGIQTISTEMEQCNFYGEISDWAIDFLKS